MSISFPRAPHIEGVSAPGHTTHALNAALLVDFDNVTMGMRSDLSKELKALLNSDVIKGKVTVQRAYADWRRYPQYIVPLSEASMDLIFAPAYGSSKKNATDIRMAIDGMELVFTRPEIGTFILLTGDSDFSSLVLKLKEYGKYVIGVGIQESSSDILVQNCDEYYSYTSLSGLRKTDEAGATPSDPWLLVERAAEQMGKRGDVMRSDRLKQVMLEIDPGFDEKSFGFNKFSRFLSEASKRKLIDLRKMENGQYEIVASKGGRRSDERKAPDRKGSQDRDHGRRPDRGRSEEQDRSSDGAKQGRAGSAGTDSVDTSHPPSSDEGEQLASAYTLLRAAISDLLEDQDSDSVRDSDVKRRMLALQSDFDEGTLGFPKFSRFLRQAHDHEVVDLRKGEGGNYHVALGSRTSLAEPSVDGGSSRAEAEPVGSSTATESTTPGTDTTLGAVGSPPPSKPLDASRRLRPREASSRSHALDGGPPPLLEGQVVTRAGHGSHGTGADDKSVVAHDHSSAEAESPDEGILDPAILRLPTGRDSVVQYLSNSYGGVGKKTAETLVDELGEKLFVVLQEDPSRVEALLPPARAEKVLEGWRADFKRRRERLLAERGGDEGPGEMTVESDGEGTAPVASGPDPSPRSRRGRRTRGGGR